MDLLIFFINNNIIFFNFLDKENQKTKSKSHTLWTCKP